MANVTPVSAKARLIEEREDLIGRISKLVAYVASPKFDGLDSAYQDLLKRQLDAMDQLQKILSERVDRLKEC